MSASMMSAYIPCSGRAATSIFRSRMSGRALTAVACRCRGASAPRAVRSWIADPVLSFQRIFVRLDERACHDTARRRQGPRTVTPPRRDDADEARARDARPDTINHILTRPPPWDDTPHDATELNETARH